MMEIEIMAVSSFASVLSSKSASSSESVIGDIVDERVMGVAVKGLEEESGK